MFFIGKMKACVLIVGEKQGYVSLTATGEKLLALDTAILFCQ
jgi:hypothetical protein